MNDRFVYVKIAPATFEYPRDQYQAVCGHAGCRWSGAWTPNRSTADKQAAKHAAKHEAAR